MPASSRFAVAIHTLTMLATSAGEPLTSEHIAGSVNTNPVVIRRMLGILRAAGLVTAHSGNGGGWRLARDPVTITLWDVYRAVGDAALFALPQRAPNPHCAVGRQIQQVLTRRFVLATQALEAEFTQTSIADLLQEVLTPTGSSAGHARAQVQPR